MPFFSCGIKLNAGTHLEKLCTVSVIVHKERFEIKSVKMNMNCLGRHVGEVLNRKA